MHILLAKRAQLEFRNSFHQRCKSLSPSLSVSLGRILSPFVRFSFLYFCSLIVVSSIFFRIKDEEKPALSKFLFLQAEKHTIRTECSSRK